MFGLSLPCQLIQGPAVRTWNCVAHFANLLWCKFNYVTNPIMPRSRRRHHSRSRTKSRSRSNSCDRDRDTKRRKVENYDSPQHKRSDSPEEDQQSKTIEGNTTPQVQTVTTETTATAKSCSPTAVTPTSKTPNRKLTPKQLQKKLEVEERKKEREKMKEEKLKLLEEKKKIKQEEHEKRVKEKQEKTEQKQKIVEERQKIKDLKEEKKKKEQEDREVKRKEKEEKDEQKRKEQDEKSKEKQKIEEKKQKAATAFVSFFKKKNESVSDEKKLEKPVTFTFMPFEIKSDMRLAPLTRVTLDTTQKQYIIQILETQSGPSYLDELRSGKRIGKGFKTWPFSDAHNDVILVEDVNPGESIEEQSKFSSKQRIKFFKFDENRRPAYFGTWRKKSVIIKPRKPFAVDSKYFDYEVDSDDEWEQEDSGESLQGSDDDKENDSENEYEEDNEFFVPHGHLSDDEVNDDENSIISPEAHKAKLKLLKKRFEEEMRSKTEKIKPRVIGCIWYNKDSSNVDAAIDEFLKPFSIISNGPIVIKKRRKYVLNTPVKRPFLRGKDLSAEFIPNFLKWIHGSSKNSKSLVKEFMLSLEGQDVNVEVTKTSLIKQLKKFAAWTRSPDGGPVLKRHCWFVHKNISEEYNVNLPTPI